VRVPFRSAARCGSWSPVPAPGPGHADHLPQDCGACWRPCGAPVPPGRGRCARCEQALAAHPSARVRYELTREPVVRPSVLLVLSADPDDRVRCGAEFRLITMPPESRPAEAVRLEGDLRG
jgi:hypothetical protein